MYKILIVGALSQETNVIKEEIKKLELMNFKTSYLTTGMGNYNMILNLTRFLENHDFDLVLNIGVCGYKNDISLFQREYPKGEGLFPFIQVARIFNISNKKELIVPHIIDFGSSESIASSELVMFDNKKMGDENYIDMESYGFEIVCDSFSIPRIILKIPVDRVGEETKNFDFEKAENNLRNNIDYKELFKKIDKYLETTFFSGKGKYKQHVDIFETYNEHFSFTFSENEIFKRLFYRYLALINKDFNGYYIDNKDLDKKKFLKKLEKHLDKYLVK